LAATWRARRSPGGGRPAGAAIAIAFALVVSATAAEAAPPIRTSATNPVPACVTPNKLMAFLTERNTHLNPKFRNIASWYKYYGDAWRVRWDYAFFQMALETNFLTYRRGDGRPGDVKMSQNNFAGIGATGGGVRGERFPDVQTGVHAQIQHLVAYSGERIADPIALRTQKVQDDVVEVSQRLGRPVTFGDLARRWAVDRAYGKSIDYLAGLFKKEFCTGDDTTREARGPAVKDVPKPQPVHRKQANNVKPAPAKPAPGGRKPAVATATTDKGESLNTVKATARIASKESSPLLALPSFKIAPLSDNPSKLGGPVPDATPAAATEAANRSAAGSPCRVLSASYGGTKTLLVRSKAGGETRFTALTVLEGFENSMFDTYAKAEAPGAEVIGEYPSDDQALAEARQRCPGGPAP
jgi:hypothetical protein